MSPDELNQTIGMLGNRSNLKPEVVAFYTLQALGVIATQLERIATQLEDGKMYSIVSFDGKQEIQCSN